MASRTYTMFVTNGGTAATGLSPVFDSLYAVDDGQDLISGAPSITEIGGGLYKFTYDATEKVVGVIDCDPASSPALSDPDRYKAVEMTPGDTQLEAVIEELSQGKPTATPLLKDAIMLLYMALRNQSVTTEEEYAVYSDDGTKIAKQTLTDDGSAFTRGEMESGA